MRFSDQYQILEIIAEGSYGIVCKALDKTTGETVAVKQAIYGMCRSTSTEIDILQKLPRHRRIVELKNVMVADDGVFVGMEYMEHDLKSFREEAGRPFKLGQIKFFMKAILEGVSFLHHERVMHRDLKPSNILLNHKGCEIKICDFGLSAPFGEAGAVSFCPRVGTKSYKAPEILRGVWTYTCAVDVWAVGCIMAEMVMDRVLFPGGSEADEQLDCIHKVMVNRRFSRLGTMVETAAMSKGTARLSAAGIELLHKLLACDASKRLTAADALHHRWFREFS